MHDLTQTIKDAGSKKLVDPARAQAKTAGLDGAAKEKAKQANARAAANKRREAQAKQQRLGRREAGGLENKMNQLVKAQRDPRAAERAAREKANLEAFIK